MKNEEPKTMRELHRLREKHYYRTRKIPLKKILKKIDEKAKEIENRYDLNLERIK